MHTHLHVCETFIALWIVCRLCNTVAVLTFVCFVLFDLDGMLELKCLFSCYLFACSIILWSVLLCAPVLSVPCPTSTSLVNTMTTRDTRCRWKTHTSSVKVSTGHNAEQHSGNRWWWPLIPNETFCMHLPGPAKRFPAMAVSNILKDVLTSYLQEEKYEAELCRQMTKTISEVSHWIIGTGKLKSRPCSLSHGPSRLKDRHN